MGKPPAVVIIARHGARLDAADKQWHLTSPTPYDPPLTYGGWTQSRALGVRIASLLQARESSHDTNTADGVPEGPNGILSNATNGGKERTEHRSKRRKHKIIIHSSPFLRCIQTSIAISAGIAQYDDTNQQGSSYVPRQTSISKSHVMHSGSPRLHSVDNGKIHRLSAIVEPEDGSLQSSQKKPVSTKNNRKCQLRVDAFLGEWLSPDYFDMITPPPSSLMMLAAAKADLLRSGDDFELKQSISRSTTSAGTFPGGWGSGGSSITSSTAASDDEEGPFSDISNIAQTLPKIIRASSHSNAGMSGTKANHNGLSKLNTGGNSGSGIYVPPVPHYAISTSAPIPAGYVTHAREACVNVDHRWDSMRPPLDWGNGGEYGEEWSLMHKRFRRGLHEMILWYRMQETQKIDGNGSASGSPRTGAHDDDDTDTVLILVTHGAGCNALIGALTNQPVLLDVGMASLTMAIRKDSSNGSGAISDSPQRRRSSIDLGISEDYDLRLVASTEHLRTDSSPLNVPQFQPSPRVGSQPVSIFRHHYGSTASATSTNGSIDGGFSLPEPADHSFAAVTGSLERSNSISNTKTGLWSKPDTTVSKALPEDNPASKITEDQKLAIKNVLGNGTREYEQAACEKAANMKKDDDEVEQKSPVEIPDEDVVTPVHALLNRTNSQRGLWGATPQIISQQREQAPKRRWTVNERESN